MTQIDSGLEFLENIERAELSICDDAASFLQSGFWGSFKAKFGWEALAFKAVWKNDAAGLEGSCSTKPLLVLRRVLYKGFALAYIPWGPELPANYPNKENALVELAASLKKILPKDTMFIRFDPPWAIEININDKSVQTMPNPFIRSAADIQPPDTVIIDLSESMESLKAQMKPKWRYNANLALKKGVQVNRAENDKISVFYDLLKETAVRDGISIHSFNYYQALFNNVWYSGKTPDLRLYLAEHEEDTLAGIVTLFRNREAVYLYGASSNKKRNFMASYALQLKAIEDAKLTGCISYDLFGIPPNEDPSHPMAGLYQFKTGFGGQIIHRPGSWDYPCRPIVYRLFCQAEAFRQILRKLRKRR